MRISILSDSNWEAKIDHAVRCLTLRQHFEDCSYGDGVLGVSIVLNARDPKLGHRQRVRFSKAEKILYIDVMLDLSAMIKASHQTRRDIVCEAVCIEIATIMKRRRFRDFDTTSFLEEFERAIREDLQGGKSSRFDHLSLPQATGT